MWLVVSVALVTVFSTTKASDENCQSKSVLTFNAGLVPLVPLYESRKARIAPAVAEVNADIVCLQEVVYEDDIRDILDELKQQYPFSWSFHHSTYLSKHEVYTTRYFGALYRYYGEKAFPCEDETFKTFKRCLAEKCTSYKSGIPLLLCLFSSCRVETFALPTNCLSCIANSVFPVETAMLKCATPRRCRNRFQPEGLLILSKRPIKSAKKVHFVPCVTQVFPRGLLEVDVLGIGKVACTHLTSDVSEVLGIPYVELKLMERLGITSYADQQSHEIEKIKDIYNGSSVLLAGDLNTGPIVLSQNISGQVLHNYESLTDQGYQNPYVDLVGQCTYCPENPVAYPQKDILDHVLVNGYQVLGATRILDNHNNPLSDHYGVEVTVC